MDKGKKQTTPQTSNINLYSLEGSVQWVNRGWERAVTCPRSHSQRQPGLINTYWTETKVSRRLLNADVFNSNLKRKCCWSLSQIDYKKMIYFDLRRQELQCQTQKRWGEGRAQCSEHLVIATWLQALSRRHWKMQCVGGCKSDVKAKFYLCYR